VVEKDVAATATATEKVAAETLTVDDIAKQNATIRTPFFWSVLMK